MTELVDPNVELHGTVGGLEEGKILRGPSQIERSQVRILSGASSFTRIEPVTSLALRAR